MPLKIYNDILGNITVSNKGIKSGVSHKPLKKDNIDKFDGFKAIKDVLEKGKIINVSRNYSGIWNNRIVIAAPIMVRKIPYYMGVVLKRNIKSKSQTYYFHNVLLKEKKQFPFKDTAETYMASSRVGETASVYNILQQLNNINNISEKDIVSDVGKFQLKDGGDNLNDDVTIYGSDISKVFYRIYT